MLPPQHMPLGAGRSLHLLHPCLAEHEQTYHCRIHKAIWGAGRTFSSILTKPADSLSSLDLPALCSCGADQPAQGTVLVITLGHGTAGTTHGRAGTTRSRHHASSFIIQAGRICLPPAAAVRINLHRGSGSTCSQMVILSRFKHSASHTLSATGGIYLTRPALAPAGSASLVIIH